MWISLKRNRASFCKNFKANNQTHYIVYMRYLITKDNISEDFLCEFKKNINALGPKTIIVFVFHFDNSFDLKTVAGLVDSGKYPKIII